MGVIYFITIPSMYLFLVIYSVFNLNVVSWGTREVPKRKTAEEMEAEKKEAEEEAKKPPKKKTGIAGERNLGDICFFQLRMIRMIQRLHNHM